MGQLKPFTGILSTREMLQAIEKLEGAPVPERTLTYWTHDGLVPASVRGQRGRRIERWYSRADLLRRLGRSEEACLRADGLIGGRVGWSDAIVG